MVARPNESLRDHDASIRSAAAVTLSPDATFTRITRGVYVGVTGNLQVQFCDDADANSVILVGLAAGVWHPLQIQKIIGAGTTASSIVVGY